MQPVSPRRRIRLAAARGEGSSGGCLRLAASRGYRREAIEYQIDGSWALLERAAPRVEAGGPTV
jgi:hypothetical protein